MSEIVAVLLLLTAWNVVLTLRVLRYRKAIIRLQEHMAWVLDYLTTPKAGDKIPTVVRRIGPHRS